MTSRREFPRSVKAAIVKRAMNERGLPVCEGCGLVLAAKKYHIDHTIPDALYLDKSRPLTAADGKLLGVECCHKPKSAIDAGVLAKSERREAKHNGFQRKAARPILGSRSTPFKAKIGGGWERRT